MPPLGLQGDVSALSSLLAATPVKHAARPRRQCAEISSKTRAPTWHLVRKRLSGGHFRFFAAMKVYRRPSRAARSCGSTTRHGGARRGASCDAQREWPWRVIARELLDRKRRERLHDAIPQSPQWVAHVALGVLIAALVRVRASRHRHRPVDCLNDVGQRDERGWAGEMVPAVCPLVRYEQPVPGEPLQHLGHQLNGDVVLPGDLASARGCPPPNSKRGPSTRSTRSRFSLRAAA